MRQSERAGWISSRPAFHSKNRLTVGPNHEKLASLKQNHTAKKIAMHTLTKPTEAAMTAIAEKMAEQ